jgi:hypothetical protein
LRRAGCSRWELCPATTGVSRSRNRVAGMRWARWPRRLWAFLRASQTLGVALAKAPRAVAFVLAAELLGLW